MKDQQKTIAVTGANRGIGAAIAIELARRGHHVACLARNGQRPVHDLGDAIDDRLFPLTCDVTDENQIVDALRQTDERGDGLDGVVNNAGVLEAGPSVEISLDSFRRVLETNVTGYFAVSQQAYPYLQKSRGLIVNIGSFWGRLGARQHAAYCASKAGVEGLTRALAVEWARAGVRVLCVAPGYVETDLNRELLETPKFQTFIKARAATGTPVPVKDIADLIGGLFQEDLGGLTGETIYVDGGHSVNN